MQQKESSMFNEDIYRQKNGRGLAKDLQKSSEETKCTCNPAQRYGPKITDKKKKKTKQLAAYTDTMNHPGS